jgi:hypothetical protein
VRGRESVVDERLLDQLGRTAQLELLEPRDALRGFGLRSFAILLGMDRL